jgi:hypothetical protein
MCNPRRVHVRATRELAEAWAQEVRRQATRTGRAVGESRVRESLAGVVGGPTLAALADVLARIGGWTEFPDGIFTHQLDGGVISFDLNTRELELAATLSAEVSVIEEASATVDAHLSGTVEAEGEGVYYDDGWGGLNAQTAQRDAARKAAAAIDEAVRQRRVQASREADAAASDAVEREAASRAEETLAAITAVREDELRRAAAERLTAIGVQGRALFNAALAEAYRDAIIAYARSRRASNLHQSEQNGLLDIEFELEV